MSFSWGSKHLDRKVGSPADYRYHQSHDRSNSVDNIKEAKVESRVSLTTAGKKADAQRENGPATQFQTIPSSIGLPTGVLWLPVSTSTAASLSVSSSALPLQKPLTSESPTTSQPSASQSLAPVLSSHSSLMRFPPGLLAFILIFACLFILLMFLAFYRMCRRRASSFQPASPLFLGNATNLDPQRHWNSLEVEKPKSFANNSTVQFGQIIQREMTDSRTKLLRNSRPAMMDADFPNPMQATRSMSTNLRVLRPCVPQPHNGAHTTDPKSVISLTASDDFGGYRHQPRIKGSGKQNRNHVEKKGKENMTQDNAVHHRKRTTLLAHPSYRLVRPLSIIPEVIDSSTILNLSLDTKSQAPTPSLSVRQSEGGSALVPSLLTTGAVAVDIGLAMLAEFSPPTKENLFDPSIAGSPLLTDRITVNGTMDSKHASLSSEPGGSYILPNLTQSASSESTSLAYMASESSRSLTVSNIMMEERDVTDGNTDVAYTSKLEADPDSRAQAQARLLQQLDFALDPGTYALEPRSFKAPTLPTLSEMALSRTDPLYESVTNELFSSYGVRMSTSVTERVSRVSARISRMLSWFGGERFSVDSTLSGEVEWICEERAETTGTVDGGVQPLRIGKLRKE